MLPSGSGGESEGYDKTAAFDAMDGAGLPHADVFFDWSATPLHSECLLIGQLI